MQFWANAKMTVKKKKKKKKKNYAQWQKYVSNFIHDGVVFNAL